MEVLCPGESLSDGVWFLTAADNTEEDFFFFFPHNLHIFTRQMTELISVNC